MSLAVVSWQNDAPAIGLIRSDPRQLNNGLLMNHMQHGGERANWKGDAMPELAQEIALFEKLRRELEAKEMGKWALIRDDALVGTFQEFEEAADEAVRRFGRGPYLIREIGSPDVTLPASVVYAVTLDAQ